MKLIIRCLLIHNLKVLFDSESVIAEIVASNALPASALVKFDDSAIAAINSE